jgi:hypothetical protein
MDRILLGQLGANGDCLYATILARQIRQDFPNAEITWAVSSKTRAVLVNNPHIDAIWEIPISSWDQHEIAWRVFEQEALRRYVRRDFDALYLSQIWPNNFQNYDGTIRPSILRSYGRPITVPIENVIQLTNAEIERVESFVQKARIAESEHRIIFECSSTSRQSFVTPDFAQIIANELYNILPNACVIFSTHLPMDLRNPRSRYAGELSLREIAQLTHHSTLFVGSGSGCSVAATSTAAAPLPMLQLLAASTSVFASFAHDFEYFGINRYRVIELTTESPKAIARCIAAIALAGIDSAEDEFRGRVPVNFTRYFSQIESFLISKLRYLDAAHSLSITAERYGWLADLVRFGQNRIEPRLSVDSSIQFSAGRAAAEKFRCELAMAAQSPAAEPKQGRWQVPRRPSQ